MNDYWNEQNEFVCGRCKTVICKDDGTCECEGYVDGDKKMVVMGPEERKSIFEFFVEGQRIGQILERGENDSST